MQGYFDPTEVPREEVEKFVFVIFECAAAALKERGDLTASPQVLDGVKVRTRLKRMQTSCSLREAFNLLCMDVEEIGKMIRYLQYVERYRFYAQDFPVEMFMALRTHSYALRASEIYVIQERGTDTLRFANLVLRDLGLEAKDMSKRFSKLVATKFKHRLRERHRIVHNHEAPSMATRMLQMDRYMRDRKSVESHVRMVADLLSNTPVELPAGLHPLNNPVDFYKKYVLELDKESAELWEQFRNSFVEGASMRAQ